MKKIFVLGLFLAGLEFSFLPESLIKTAFLHAQKQTELLLLELSNQPDSPKVSPRTLSPTGELETVAARDWTSGFFPGQLWYLYEYTGESRWAQQARKFTSKLEKEKLNGSTHDMGFKMYCSYGNGYRLTQDPVYKNVLIQSARTLMTRFKSNAGILRSWDHHRERWQCPVIIDNMMNLELLFAATRLTGDSSFYHVAKTHALTTLKNHYRPDYSSYHVVDYDTLSGKVLQRQTHQGYSDESAWSRGQAWGLYGFTLCYRETKNPAFLKQADAIAHFMLNHPRMPKDLIPYYDYDAPQIPNAPRDASAAAVLASGLYELSQYSIKGKEYRQIADRIIENLTKNYLSPLGKNHGFTLIHSTGSKPHAIEIDVPLIYADYYFLEALLRAKKLNEKKALF